MERGCCATIGTAASRANVGSITRRTTDGRSITESFLRHPLTSGRSADATLWRTDSAINSAYDRTSSFAVLQKNGELETSSDGCYRISGAASRTILFRFWPKRGNVSQHESRAQDAIDVLQQLVDRGIAAGGVGNGPPVGTEAGAGLTLGPFLEIVH